MITVAQTVLSHLKGIMGYFTNRVTNAVMEANNSKLRTITKRFYGFKTLRYLRLMIFLVFGKLKFDVPQLIELCFSPHNSEENHKEDFVRE